jgi:hypothetical protein
LSPVAVVVELVVDVGGVDVVLDEVGASTEDDVVVVDSGAAAGTVTSATRAAAAAASSADATSTRGVPRVLRRRRFVLTLAF